MKKIIIILCMVFLNFTLINARENNEIIDKANILNNEEIIKLEEIAKEYENKYGIEFVIYADNDEIDDEIKYHAADIYDYGEFDSDGVMLYINMNIRKYFVLTTGDEVINELTDYGLDYINKKIEENLREGDYYMAGLSFFEGVAELIDYYKTNSVPYDINNHHQTNPRDRLKIALITGGVMATTISLVVGIILSMQLKSVKKQHTATAYAIDDNRFGYLKADITRAYDMFLYKNVSCIKIQRNSSSGGSSTFRGSSGVSHGGRGGSF